MRVRQVLDGRRAAVGLFWSAALWAAGCGAAPDLVGATAWLRVEGAQFRLGAVPRVDGGGPSVAGILDEQSTVRRGEVGHALSGSLAAGATAVALALDGDRGYWTLAAGVPDVTAPEQPTFAAHLSLSPATPLGRRDLRVYAADAAGMHGAAAIDPLTIVETPVPTGALTFSLAWDAEADLDLHVVEPGGVEIWSRAPRDAATGGALGQDSNAGCQLDGARSESVTWSSSPPAGRYLARVDCASLCGVPAADWRLTARRDGAVIGQAYGQCVESSTRGSHDRGAGLLALDLVVE